MLDKRPSPFGGWLLLFTVQYGYALVANSLYAGARIPRVWHLFHSPTSYGHSVAWLALGVAVLEVSIAASICCGIVLMARRHALTPRFWRFALTALFVANGIATALLYREHVLALQAGRPSTMPPLARYVEGLVLAALFTVLWTRYWSRSRRVLGVFGPPPPPPTGGILDGAAA